MPRSLVVKIAALAAASAAAGPARAQLYLDAPPRTLEVTPYAGFFWSGSVTTSNGSVVFRPAADVGATVGFQVDAKSQIEVLYLYARPQAQFASVNPVYASSPWFDVTSQYLQLGGTTTFSATETVEPFLSGGLGLAWFSPSDVQVEGSQTIQPADTWLFAWNLGLGLKWFLSRSVGLRFGARILMPVYFTQGTFLSGPNGAAVTVNAGIPLVQGDLSIGLVIAP